MPPSRRRSTPKPRRGPALTLAPDELAVRLDWLAENPPGPVRSADCPLWLMTLWARHFSSPGRQWVGWWIRNEINQALGANRWSIDHDGTTDVLGVTAWVSEPYADLATVQAQADWFREVLGCPAVAFFRGWHPDGKGWTGRVLLLPPAVMPERGALRRVR